MYTTNGNIKLLQNGAHNIGKENAKMYQIKGKNPQIP